MKKIVILISGRGSNMQAIVDAGIHGAQVAAVIANSADASGLAWAAERGIETAVISHREHASREDFDAALSECIDGFAPDLVVLAGFMRILGSTFVAHFAGRLLNIHPSLLPSFPGLHTHERALQQGVKVHGCTVHFVTADLDHGPIIVQAAVPVADGDTPDGLAARVLQQEHKIYAEAIRWFVDGRLRIEQGRVHLADARSHGALVSPALFAGNEEA